MSPASQGGVEVERYIGSCLISSSIRPGSHKPIVGRKQEAVIRGKTRGCYGTVNFPSGTEQCQVQYGPGGWTGAPLISMTSSPRRCTQRSSPSLGQQQQQQSPSPQQQQSPSPQQQQQACDQQVSVHLHKNPLSRLAIHTQGAPLILANRFHNRGKIHNSGNANGIANAVCSNTGAVNSYVHNNVATVTSNCTMNNSVRCPPSRPQRPIELGKKQQTNAKSSDCTATKETANTGNNIANIDSLSIASDESSGSNNSENSLPRIIKPRKRRKKDRKPPNNTVASVEAKHDEQQQQSNSSVANEQPSAGSLKPYVPACYEQRYEAAPHLRNHRRPPIARERTTGSMSVQEIADARQRYPHRHVEVKVLDDNRNIVVPAQMRTIPPKGYRHNGHHHHHNHAVNGNGNNVLRYLHEYNEPTATTGCEDGINDELGPCQCRYCDPAALIWDVEQNCYSPFLTPSPSTDFCPGHFPQMPLFLSRPSLNCPEQSIERLFNGDNVPRAHQEKDGTTGVVLRRSWSDPTSYFSEEISTPSKDFGVIGDRGQAESGKRRTLWRGDSIGIPVSNVGPSGMDVNGSTVQSPKELEVSTEIITSPNGHRDLEIKFYSPSPNAPISERKKCIFAEEVDEDEEDFSDIWSYHESKLQQDFRTLLQAEE